MAEKDVAAQFFIHLGNQWQLTSQVPLPNLSPKLINMIQKEMSCAFRSLCVYFGLYYCSARMKQENLRRCLMPNLLRMILTALHYWNRSWFFRAAVSNKQVWQHCQINKSEERRLYLKWMYHGSAGFVLCNYSNKMFYFFEVLQNLTEWNKYFHNHVLLITHFL